MKSKYVGNLKIDKYDEDLYCSEPFEIPYFGNQKVTIGISHAYLRSTLEDSDEVLGKFLALNTENRNADSEIVNRYYNQSLNAGMTKPLNILKDQDVWNFVTPSEIIIDAGEKGALYIYISCGCKWNEEHGLQLIFKNGVQLTSAGGHQ